VYIRGKRKKKKEEEKRAVLSSKPSPFNHASSDHHWGARLAKQILSIHNSAKIPHDRPRQKISTQWTP
jgi:hypothetical protein